MRRISLFILLAVLSIVAIAQTNPKSGYVITNTGDTIRGIIDFRTNEKLSKQCNFYADGGSTCKTYVPGDIEGFRFDDNGKYFVTRRLNVDGNLGLYFAEFMVQGKMNLYCVVNNSDEYFFFEREDGEMAQLTNRSVNLSHSVQAFQEEKQHLQEKKAQYGKVTTLLKDSWKALDDMKEKDMTRKKLVNVVRDYHSDVCTDGSKCMVYEYNEKSDKIKSHFKAFAGYAYYSQERTDHQYFLDENYPGSAMEIGIGIEMDFERVVKGGSVELGLSYSPKTSSEHNIQQYGQTVRSRYEKGRITVSVGVVKRFGEGKILPLVRGGGFVVSHFGTREINYRNSHKVYDGTYGSTTHFGVYLGAGVQIALGKHYARLHGDWYKSIEPKSIGNMMKWGIAAEFAL